MHAIHQIPADLPLPPIERLLVGRPRSWQGMDLAWTSDEEAAAVYIAHFRLPRPDDVVDVIYSERATRSPRHSSAETRWGAATSLSTSWLSVRKERGVCIGFYNA